MKIQALYTLYSLDSLPTELWGPIKTNNSTGVEDNIVQFLLESSLLLLCYLANLTTHEVCTQVLYQNSVMCLYFHLASQLIVYLHKSIKTSHFNDQTARYLPLPQTTVGLFPLLAVMPVIIKTHLRHTPPSQGRREEKPKKESLFMIPRVVDPSAVLRVIFTFGYAL